MAGARLLHRPAGDTSRAPPPVLTGVAGRGCWWRRESHRRSGHNHGAEFSPSEDYLATNLANWNSRVPHHVAEYGLEEFRDDPAHLSSVVRFDLPRLGDLTGRDVVHLQCHIGSDTVSLARLGARRSPGLTSRPQR